MIPGIVDSPLVYTTLPAAPAEILEPVPVELVYSQEINAEDTGVINITGLGDDFVGRFFIVSWVGTRVVTTGGSLTQSFLVNDQASPFSFSEANFGFKYNALVVVSGTSMTLRFSNAGGIVRRFTVWKVGTPTIPGQVVSMTGAASGSGTASVTVNLRSDVLSEDTQILAITGARPQNTGDTFTEAWLTTQITDQEFHRQEDSRIQYTLGTVPPATTSFTLPDSSPTSRLKEGRYFQVRQKRTEETPFNLQYTNLKYRFDSAVGCYLDTDGIIPCTPNDPVAFWKNLGASTNALQSSRARRPLFKVGGAGGYPYIECLRENQQYFEDLLDLTQPSGLTGWTPLTVTFVAHFYDYNTRNPIFGDGSNVYKAAVDVQTSGRLRMYVGTFETMPLIPVNQTVVVTARLRSNTNLDCLVSGSMTSRATICELICLIGG